MAMPSQARLGHVPHFEVTAVDGHRVRYEQIWQRRNLVLLLVAAGQHEAAARYASQLEAHRRELEDAETTVVVTADAVAGFGPPRLVIADRWGEIIHVETLPGDDTVRFPSIDDVLSWVRFARMQCPECPP